jgi:branched-chain amino acid transport system substrate-binding protein
VRAEAGVTANRILFGEVAAFKGPTAALGLALRAGILAAFAEVNRQGGIAGREIQLISRDDGYEPTRSIEATRRLIDEDNVFALIGPLGTPTCIAAQPVAAAAGVPFIAPFTGAAFLRGADMTNVFNLRASYFQETAFMVRRLRHDLGCSRIAVMYQDDAYGRAGLDGTIAALARINLKPVAEGIYERNTVAIKGAVLSVREGNPDAVIMIGAYKPCAAFIRLAHEIKLDPTFVNISFVGSDALAKELGPDGAGVAVTQVVPFPFDATIPVVARYQAALKAMNPAQPLGFVSLEGYMAGLLSAAALRLIAGGPTRAGLMRAFVQGSPFDLGGFPIDFGPERNQGSNQVFLTVLQADGRFRQVSALARNAS